MVDTVVGADVKETRWQQHERDRRSEHKEHILVHVDELDDRLTNPHGTEMARPYYGTRRFIEFGILQSKSRSPHLMDDASRSALN